MTARPFPHRHLLGIEGLKPSEITAILDASEAFFDISRRPIRKAPTLRGKTVINLFYEPSTRTRTSFELAGKRLSADVINISVSTSSASHRGTIAYEVPTPSGSSTNEVDRSRTVNAAPAASDTVMRPNSSRPHPAPTETQPRSRSLKGHVGMRRAPNENVETESSESSPRWPSDPGGSSRPCDALTK